MSFCNLKLTEMTSQTSINQSICIQLTKTKRQLQRNWSLQIPNSSSDFFANARTIGPNAIHGSAASIMIQIDCGNQARFAKKFRSTKRRHAIQANCTKIEKNFTWIDDNEGGGSSVLFAFSLVPFLWETRRWIDSGQKELTLTQFWKYGRNFDWKQHKQTVYNYVQTSGSIMSIKQVRLQNYYNTPSLWLPQETNLQSTSATLQQIQIQTQIAM